MGGRRKINFVPFGDQHCCLRLRHLTRDESQSVGEEAHVIFRLGRGGENKVHTIDTPQFHLALMTRNHGSVGMKYQM